MIVTRPVRFTDSTDAHRRLFEALGGRCLSDFGSWVVYAVGNGRVALHTADETFPAGQTTLGFETADLQFLADAARPRIPSGVQVRLDEAPHGRAVMVTGADGVTFTVDPLTTDPHTTDPHTTDPVSVIAMWVTDQVEAAVDTLTVLGGSVRLTADDGVWTDLRTDAGFVGIHSGTTTDVQFGFEYAGDITDLLEPLAAAGIEATLIDESYTRTLRLPDPDRADRQIWISEEQRDMYGYRNLD